MSFAVDTNVLLRSIDDGHPAQAIAENALMQLRDRGEPASIFSQNLIEFWAVATRPIANNGFGWSVERVERELADLKKLFVVLDDTDRVLPEWQSLVIRHRVVGKQAHDAHLVASMLAYNLTHLLTFNDSDFKRFTEIIVVKPQDVT